MAPVQEPGGEWLPQHRIRLSILVSVSVLATVVCVLLPTTAPLIAVGAIVGAAVGATLAMARPPPAPSLPFDLETPLLIARDEQLFDRYRRVSSLLLKVSQHHDPVYRDIALEQVDELATRLTSIAAGTLVFEGTETWRIVYERLLRSPGLFLYRSVAWIKSAGYWQDEPGRKSMLVNFDLHDRERLMIERIAIVADELWRDGSPRLVEPIHGWLQQHVARGIPIRVVRQSALASEPDLIADIGIYGSRALGTQFLDEHCRTVRFALCFDYPRVVEAEARWNRLAVYAESYSVHLDRTPAVE